MDMMIAYEKATDEFEEWMIAADTEPSIAAFFNAALKERDFPPEDEWSTEETTAARREQVAIGWDNILFGRISQKWMKLQQAYLTSKRSRKSPERWAADMVYKLLQVSHTLWITRNGILHERDQQGLRHCGRPLVQGMGAVKLRSYQKTTICWTALSFAFSKCRHQINTRGLEQ
jgi:hypothetical protein